MSMNAGKGPKPGQRQSPSKKRTNATSPKIETSKFGSSKSPVQTLDKFLIKRPAIKTNNNKCSDSKTESRPTDDSANKGGHLNGSGIVCTKSKTPQAKKETTPESELELDDIIVVDDSQTELESSRTAKASISEEKEKFASDSETKSLNGKKEGNCESNDTPAHTSKVVDDGHSTSDCDVADADKDEIDTQEYDLNPAGDARSHVDYKEEDFNTDSDLNISETESNGGKSGRQPGGKKKTAFMGGCHSQKRKKYQEQCEGSSSDEDEGRPWRSAMASGGSSHDQRKQYPKRFSLKKQWSDRDTQEYRDGYPGKRDNKHMNLNLQFYQGKIRSKPDGAYIDDIHKHWWHNLDRLETHHGYIQWLFPIRESGMNYEAQELQLHEAEAIQDDPVAYERFQKSYKMMLNFYGLKLVSKKTGEVERADNWQPRFRHLNHSMHNYLRITRILKCLGEMGLEHWKAPLLQRLIQEATSPSAPLGRTLSSCYNYWVGTLKDPNERHNLASRAERHHLSRGGR